MFHTIVVDKKTGVESLYGLDDGRHIVFPHMSWASHMINCDPRSVDRLANKRIEECLCDNTIYVADYMKLSHMERYGEKWESSYSTSGVTTSRSSSSSQPIAATPKFVWHGERRPTLTRAQRALLESS